jgi:hypothetical protein
MNNEIGREIGQEVLRELAATGQAPTPDVLKPLILSRVKKAITSGRALVRWDDPRLPPEARFIPLEP